MQKKNSFDKILHVFFSFSHTLFRNEILSLVKQLDLFLFLYIFYFFFNISDDCRICPELSLSYLFFMIFIGHFFLFKHSHTRNIVISISPIKYDIPCTKIKQYFNWTVWLKFAIQCIDFLLCFNKILKFNYISIKKFSFYAKGGKMLWGQDLEYFFS